MCQRPTPRDDAECGILPTPNAALPRLLAPRGARTLHPTGNPRRSCMSSRSPSIMRSLRRVTVALSGILLLQLSLLGAVSPCAHGYAAGDKGAHARRATSHRSDNGRTVTRAARSDGHATSHAASGPCSDDRDDSSKVPCDVPGVRGTCTEMSSCSSSQSSVATQMLQTIEPTRTRVAADEPTERASSPTVAPELPPPRV